MSDYKTVNKSALKLKGVSSGKVDKKKKDIINKPDASAPSSSNSSAPVEPRVTKTKAELAFEEARRRNSKKWLEERSQKSHKDRIIEFNQHLEQLTEHFDVPKVSWTK